MYEDILIEVARMLREAEQRVVAKIASQFTGEDFQVARLPARRTPQQRAKEAA